MTFCHACAAQANRFAPGSPAHRNNLARSVRDWPTKKVAGLDVHLSCASQVEFLAEKSADVRVSEQGVVTWASNGRVLFDDAICLLVEFGLAPGADLAASAQAQALQDAEFAAAYRKAQSATPSAEEMFEMRAAFGPGQTVVDAVSGRRTRT